MTKTANGENRKWKKGRLFFSIVYCLFSPYAVFGAFEGTETGARAASLGGAYVALGDDTFSLMYNPASLAREKRSELASEYGRFYSGLTDGSNLGQYFLGGSLPLRQGGVIAFGWKQFSLDNLYRERTFALGYGRWITSRLALGLSMKQLYHSYGVPSMIVDDSGNTEPGTPTLFAQNGASRSAFSSDLGVLYRLSPRYMLGFSIQDVNAPDLALSGNDKDTVPRLFRLGIAYQRPSGLALMTGLSERDGIPGRQDYEGVGAVEKGWNQKVMSWILRGALAVGSRDQRQLSFGFGGRLSSFLLDYAFIFNLSGVGLSDSAGTHRFSLIYRWNPPKRRSSSRSLKSVSSGGGAILRDESISVLSISTNSVQGMSPFTINIATTTSPSLPISIHRNERGEHHEP